VGKTDIANFPQLALLLPGNKFHSENLKPVKTDRNAPMSGSPEINFGLKLKPIKMG
jgi:hypothetical protein